MTLAGELPRAAGGAPSSRPKRLFAGRRWEAADTVIALATALVAVIFAVFIFLCIQGFSTTIENAKARAQTAASILSDEISWMAGSSLTALQLIDSKLSLLPAALETTDKAELENALKLLPAATRLAIYDVTGLAVQNGGSPSLPPDIGQTDYFATLVAGTDWLILPQGKDAATGESTIVFVKALGTDVFAGAAMLSISSDVLRDFWEPQDLGEDSTVNLVRNDGWLVGRHPPVTETINYFSEASPAWEQVSTSDTGNYTTISPVDGTTRVVGYQHLPDLGLIVFATISQDTIVSALWSSIITVLWLLVPIALALLGGSLLTARLLRQSGKTQRTLTAALENNDVLFREIHHRVKNNLQSVASLLQMQPIPREIKANMGQRIAAMSAVHEHIYRSNNFSTVDVKGYLQTLVESIRAGHDPNVAVIEEFEDLAVDKDAATPLGLILNEVVSNAFKHAFADGREGVLTVKLARTTDGRGMLTVEDNGVGFDPAVPAKGIGRRLIGALTQQLGGQSHFQTTPGGGSLFTLLFPLAAQPAP